jgi:hypothetical protein
MNQSHAATKLGKMASEWPGMDTTGRGLVIPEGHICILDSVAEDYERHYVVKKNYPIKHQEGVMLVTLVDLAGTHRRNEERKAHHDRNRPNARRQEHASV